MKFLPLIPYDPGMVLVKKKEKFQKRAFLFKNAFFLNISIIYHPIELKLNRLIPYDPGMVLGKIIFEKIQKWVRAGLFLVKTAFFSNISIIYHPIEVKL